MTIEISVIIPCFNEAATIATCVKEAKKVCKIIAETYEIIVVDNNSTDNSGMLAQRTGALVIKETTQGYGAAYKAGFVQARGKYIFMADGDGTYDFNYIQSFYALACHKRYDFIIGNRFNKKLNKYAMKPLHQYIGNPLLSATLRFLFKSKVKDAHCGMRLIKKKVIDAMHLTSTGMEFASEMIIKAAKQKIKTGQINISYHPRKTSSKLHSFKDGWRHLRFMLVFSPTKLFFLPGIFISILGALVMLALVNGPIQIGKTLIGVHLLLLGSLFFITGIQLLLSGYFLRVLAVNYFQERDTLIKQLQKKITFEKGVLIGSVGFGFGLISGLIILLRWLITNHGKLDVYIGIIAFTFFIAGMQIILNSFYYISIQALTESKRN